MTLRLVETDNVVPIAPADDLPTLVREFADDVEADHFPNATRILSLIQRDGGMTIVSFGKPVDNYEMIGLFEAAKFSCMADLLVADDD